MKNHDTLIQTLAMKILTLLRKAGAITVSQRDIEEYQKVTQKEKKKKIKRCAKE